MTFPVVGRGSVAGLTRDRFAGLVLAALAAFIAWETRVLPLGTFREPGPGYMPLLTAVILGALGVVVALRGGGPALRDMSWSEGRHAAMLLAACAFAALALERIGYRLTVIALLVFFLGVLERKHPLAVAVVTLALAFGSFFLFSDLLRVPLPRSPWGF
ncbi:MAG TPA: tripartite tricarboxylate transporter TctB family protein [Alphaproteobacteria bacterium]